MRLFVVILVFPLIFGGCLRMGHDTKIMPVMKDGWSSGSLSAYYVCDNTRIDVGNVDIETRSCAGCLFIPVYTDHTSASRDLQIQIYQSGISNIQLSLSSITIQPDGKSESVKPVKYNVYSSDVDGKKEDSYMYFFNLKRRELNGFILEFPGLGSACTVPPLTFKRISDSDFGFAGGY